MPKKTDFNGRYTGECTLRYLRGPHLCLGLKKKPQYIAHPLPSSIQSPRIVMPVLLSRRPLFLLFLGYMICHPPTPPLSAYIMKEALYIFPPSKMTVFTINFARLSVQIRPQGHLDRPRPYAPIAKIPHRSNPCVLDPVYAKVYRPGLDHTCRFTMSFPRLVSTIYMLTCL